MSSLFPQIGSVWFSNLYPKRIYIVMGHRSSSQRIEIKRVDTGSVSIEPPSYFKLYFTPLEKMETK